jgi:Ca2+-binding RTX toxin-like protein
MATLVFSNPQNMFAPYIREGDLVSFDSNHITIAAGDFLATYYGTFVGHPDPDEGVVIESGTLTGYEQFLGGRLDYMYYGASADALAVVDYLDADDALGLQAYLFGRNDTVRGSPYADGIRGHDGNDWLFGEGGDDTLAGDAGNDVVIGGGGFDTAWFFGLREDYTILQAPDGSAAVAYEPRGGDGLDVLAEVEQIGFANGGGPIVATASPLEYIASYGDLVGAFGANPQAGFNHFVQYGYGEGREVTFDGLSYIASYPDLIFAFGANDDAGSAHYITFGYQEDRVAGSFDGLQYIASYGDLIQAFGANRDAGSTHYIDFGYEEGRDPDTFDAAQYLDNYSDLQAVFGNDQEAATIHYISYGFYEGRVDDVLA